MMHTPPVFRDQDHNLALVRALRSLRLEDAQVVSKIVDGFENWSVQTGDDYDGYLFMVIEPSPEHLAQPPSYMVSGQTGQIELAAVHGDACQPLGRFDDIYGLTAELCSRLLASQG
jgi:hypothetical protein